jgi:CRP-like cAMP-binding protein
MAQVLDWRALAAALPMLGVLPERCRGGVALKHVDKGDVVFRRGDRPRSMFAVLAGEVRLVRMSPDGGQIILQRARHGLLAEASLDQVRYHCDAVAAGPAELVSIPRSDFKSALADDAFRSRWMAQLLHELRRVRAQAERLSLHTARERIVHYIEAEGEDGTVLLSQSKKDWAGELGLTHEALYRALSQMADGGLLSVDGRSISLRRPK